MWDYIKLIKEMEQRMFVSDMCDELLNNLEDVYNISDEEYKAAKKALPKLLPKETVKLLKETEEEALRFMLYCINLAFKRGLYVGFEHIFSNVPEPDDFERLINKEFIQMPKMKEYTEYYEWHIQLQNMFTRLVELADKCDDVTYEHMKAIDSAWDERGYASFRYGYYMGYRYALFIVSEVKPGKEYTGATVMTMCSEQELGFETSDEQAKFLNKLILAYNKDAQTRKTLSELIRLI